MIYFLLVNINIKGSRSRGGEGGFLPEALIKSLLITLRVKAEICAKLKIIPEDCTARREGLERLELDPDPVEVEELDPGPVEVDEGDDPPVVEDDTEAALVEVDRTEVVEAVEGTPNPSAWKSMFEELHDPEICRESAEMVILCATICAVAEAFREVLSITNSELVTPPKIATSTDVNVAFCSTRLPSAAKLILSALCTERYAEILPERATTSPEMETCCPSRCAVGVELTVVPCKVSSAACR